MKCAIIAASLIVCVFIGYARAQMTIEEVLLNEESTEEAALLALLEELRASPLDLNAASLTAMTAIPLVTPVLAAKIIALRRQRGGFFDVEDLLELPEIDRNFLSLIGDLVTVRQRRRKRNIRATLRSRGIIKYDSGVPSPSTSPLKSYLRFEVNSASRFRFGGLAEKDPGEKKLNDYYGLFLEMQLSPLRSKILLGNFALESGQGLVYGGGFGAPSGGNPIYPFTAQSRGIRPYTSADENAGANGFALESSLGALMLTCFYSTRSLHATLRQSGELWGLYTSGLFRTDLEIAKKRAVREKAIGGRVIYNVGTRGVQLGLHHYSAVFSRNFNDPDSIRKRFVFRGTANSVSSFSAALPFGDAHLFAEMARCTNGGVAAVAGALFEYRGVKLLIRAREYGRDYVNFFGNAASSSGAHANNQRGIYAGLSWKVATNVRFGGYFDSHKTRWRTYFLPMPVCGERATLQVDVALRDGVTLCMRGGYKKSPVMETRETVSGSTAAVILENAIAKYRITLSYQPRQEFFLRGCAEMCLLYSDRKHRYFGFAIYHEARVMLYEKVRGYARLVFFDSPEYATRSYLYEHEVPGAMANRSFFGRGTHFYLLLRCTFGKTLELSGKYSNTYYESAKVGADIEIRSILSMQLDWKL